MRKSTNKLTLNIIRTRNIFDSQRKIFVRKDKNVIVNPENKIPEKKEFCDKKNNIRP